MSKLKDRIFNYTIVSPWLLTFIVFWVFPLAYSLYLSFNRYESLSGNAQFIGLGNYTKMFNDPIFWKALKNTAIFASIAVPGSTILALFMAVLLNSKLAKFTSFFRASFFMPSVTSIVVISLIFTNLYAKDGYINFLLHFLGLPYPERGWLLEPSSSLLSIILLDIWINAGYYMVLFLAGMQAIPSELYEYGQTVGVNAWQKFTKITLPLLRPTMIFVLLINTIKSFQVFVEILVMTKGGPMKSTTTLVYLIFQNAFDHTDMMGYASAMAYVLFFILLILSILQSKVMKEKV